MTAIQLTPVEVTAVQIANVLTAQPVGLLAPCLLGSQTPQVIKWWTPVVCTAAAILPGFSGAQSRDQLRLLHLIQLMLFHQVLLEPKYRN